MEGKHTVAIRMPIDMKKVVESIAKSEKRSLSSQLLVIVDKYLQELGEVKNETENR